MKKNLALCSFDENMRNYRQLPGTFEDNFLIFGGGGSGGGSGWVSERPTSADAVDKQDHYPQKDSYSTVTVAGKCESQCVSHPGELTSDDYSDDSLAPTGEVQGGGHGGNNHWPSPKLSVQAGPVSPEAKDSATKPKPCHSTSSSTLDNCSEVECYTDSAESCSSIDWESSTSAVIERRTSRILDQLMAVLQEWLETILRTRGVPNGQQSSYKCPQAVQTSIGCSSQSSHRPSAQKRQRSDSDDEFGEGDDGAPDQNQGKSWAITDTPEIRYVCPFFKHDRDRYKTSQWKSCCWPGWVSAHRVKEHLYRRHMLPKFRCNRCRQGFKSAYNLNEHQRADTICPRRSEEPEEGIDEEQERLLRVRKRKNGKSRYIGEAEKWAGMYKILFPHDDPIPSPYAELCPLQPEQDMEQPGANMLDSFENFARREFSRRMRPRAERLIDGILEQSLTSQTITNVASNVLQGIMQSFRAGQNQEARQPETEDSSLRSPSPQGLPAEGVLAVSQCHDDFDSGPYSNLEINLDEILESLDGNQQLDFDRWQTEVDTANSFYPISFQVEQYNRANT
ncbi:hypothetical protein F53441_7770 [Fusarium austroafricanum]|uniref:C2H2-type domain-containing protein n=1 Tax=Fusarium austroafricanum TaxID=2364996 RepID=A0A8H4KCU1_9HYPO|nr:hypothetical protein F53441_7770 [Fusarium austroafricanum]